MEQPYFQTLKIRSKRVAKTKEFFYENDRSDDGAGNGGTGWHGE